MLNWWSGSRYVAIIPQNSEYGYIKVTTPEKRIHMDSYGESTKFLINISVLFCDKKNYFSHLFLYISGIEYIDLSYLKTAHSDMLYSYLEFKKKRR